MEEHTNYFKKIFDRLRARKEREYAISAKRHWHAIIAIFLAACFTFSIWAAYLFYKIGHGGIFTADSEERVEIKTLNRIDFDAIVRDTRERRGEFDRIKKAARVDVLDPSR